MNSLPLPAALQAMVDSYPQRQQLFGLSSTDRQVLGAALNQVEPVVGKVVDELLAALIDMPTVAETLGSSAHSTRLHQALCAFVLETFGDKPNQDLARQRIRIGMIHKVHNVQPRYFLAGLLRLRDILIRYLSSSCSPATMARLRPALSRSLLIDASLVFDAYMHAVLSEIEEGRAQMQRYARQMEELSRTDALTGLLNVRDMKEEFTRMLASARRHGEPVTAIYIDVNDFKQINDNHGHESGDEVLQSVGHAMREISRTEDRCFRCGGDEFCILLGNCSAHDARHHLIPRLTTIVQERHPGVTISCGVAQSGPAVWLDSRALIHLADQRMYQAKRRYKRERARRPGHSTESNSSS